MAQDSHILRAIAEANTGIIFTKIDVKDPMETVFNCPMSTGNGQQVGRMIG